MVNNNFAQKHERYSNTMLSGLRLRISKSVETIGLSFKNSIFYRLMPHTAELPENRD